MYIKFLDEINKNISVAIPLTKQTDKTRIKKKLL